MYKKHTTENRIAFYKPGQGGGVSFNSITDNIDGVDFNQMSNLQIEQELSNYWTMEIEGLQYSFGEDVGNLNSSSGYFLYIATSPEFTPGGEEGGLYDITFYRNVPEPEPEPEPESEAEQESYQQIGTAETRSVVANQWWGTGPDIILIAETWY